MIRITIFLSLFFITSLNISNAQTDSLHYVKGIIKDDLSGEPIIGATISYSLGKGTQH
jgi:hypothetical protein